MTDINDTQMENTMRSSFFFAMTAAVALPLVTACGAADNHAGHSMGEITATIEKMGFTCEVKERHPKTVVQVSQCRSNKDKYLLLTVSQWIDLNKRSQMYEHTIPDMCKQLGIKDQVRWSTADSWLLVPGASKEKDVKALNEASNALGFELHAVACK